MNSVWNSQPLEELLDNNRKITYGILKPDEPCSSPKLMIRTQDYTYGWVNEERIMKVSAALDDEYKRSRVKSGDIVLTVVGNNVGRSNVVPEHYDGANISRAVARLAFKKSQSSDFHYQCLQSDWFKSFVYSQQTGGAQPVINLSSLKKLRFLCPPLPEQRKIAKILSTWDKAISTTEKLVETSKQQKKALMQQLLTGKKRLVNPETGKAFEGEWEEVKLNQLAQITMGSSPKSDAYNETGDGLPLLQGNADIKSRKSAPRIYTKQITKECSVGDILLSVRAPVGSVAKSLHNACIGRGIASIKSKSNVSQEFIYHWLLAFEPKWERFSQGSTFEAVNSNDIKTLHMAVPAFAEQQKVASVLTAADKEIEVLQAKLAHFKQEKKASMQQLLTGKRRVKVDEMEVA